MKTYLTLLCCLSGYGLLAQTDSTVRIKTDSSIYLNPEMQAEFPGGTANWYRYLSKNLRYPSRAADKNIQGSVLVTFTVDSLGYSHDITASGPEELINESVRLVKQVYRWVPAIMNGKKVNSRKIQKINYVLENGVK